MGSSESSTATCIVFSAWIVMGSCSALNSKKEIRSLTSAEMGVSGEQVHTFTRKVGAEPVQVETGNCFSCLYSWPITSSCMNSAIWLYTTTVLSS
jgi:hypothetical protein